MADAKTVPQTGQIAQITTALGKDMAFLEGFTFTESLGDPFRMTCDVVCTQRYVFGDQRGTGVGIVVTSDIVDSPELQNRAFHGVLTDAVLTDAADGEYRFRLTARPWFWVLSLGRDCRIFPSKTARQIITEVFQTAGVPADAYDMSGLSDRGTIVREYTVQFEESDFAFVSRLMEEEGIYYYFEHTAASHTMRLCDSPSAHTAFDKGDLIVADAAAHSGPHLTAFHSVLRPSIASYTMRDQHWKLFGDNREATAAVDGMVGQITPKIFEFPGGFSYLTDDGATVGTDFAKIRLDAENAESLVFTGEGSTFAVPTGRSVSVVWEGKTAKVLVIGATHRLSGQTPWGQDGSSPDLSVEIETINVEKHYRPQRLTPKPFARGPQVATVVGESGKEIDPDAFGRVRVQFPWDRSGRTNEKCSCWIRVSSSWAGPGLGETFLPRVGHEVLVSYIDGDMDRPIITGRVYNSKNTVYAKMESDKFFGATEPVDLTLAAQHATSGWITQTIEGKSTSEYDGAVDPPAAEPGYNALLFMDKSGAERLYFRAQRDLYGVTYRDVKYRTHRDVKIGTGRNLDSEVETGDETHKVTKGKRTTTINQDETLTVEQGNRAMTIQTGNETLTVKQGDMSTEVSMGNQTTAIKMGNQSTTLDMGNQTTELKLGNISVKADLGKIEMEAMQSITLTVGMSKVTIDQMGVKIEGMMLKNEATLMSQSKANIMTQVESSVLMTVKGAITMIN